MSSWMRYHGQHEHLAITNNLNFSTVKWLPHRFIALLGKNQTENEVQLPCAYGIEVRDLIDRFMKRRIDLYCFSYNSVGNNAKRKSAYIVHRFFSAFLKSELLVAQLTRRL